MTSPNHNAFFDEMNKIAGRSWTARDVADIAERLRGPVRYQEALGRARSTGGMKRFVRDMIRDDVPIDVPLKNRLKIYKTWKNTGDLHRVDRWGGVVEQPNPFRYERSEAPVRLVHGGGERSLNRAVRSGARGGEQHGPYLIPGQTHGQMYGTYAFDASKKGAEAKKGARSYALGAEGPKTSKEQGAPALLEFSVPKKHVLFSRYRMGVREAIVPATAPLNRLATDTRITRV